MSSRRIFREFNSCVKNWNRWYLEPANISIKLVTRRNQTPPLCVQPVPAPTPISTIPNSNPKPGDSRTEERKFALLQFFLQGLLTAIGRRTEANREVLSLGLSASVGLPPPPL
jgi:hypothetical protein